MTEPKTEDRPPSLVHHRRGEARRGEAGGGEEGREREGRSGRPGKRPWGISEAWIRLRGEDEEGGATPKPPALTRSFQLSVKIRMSRGQETTSQFL